MAALLRFLAGTLLLVAVIFAVSDATRLAGSSRASAVTMQQTWSAVSPIRRVAPQRRAEADLLAVGRVGGRLADAVDGGGHIGAQQQERRGEDGGREPAGQSHETLPKSTRPIVRLPSPRRPSATSHHVSPYDHGTTGACSATWASTAS